MNKLDKLGRAHSNINTMVPQGDWREAEQSTQLKLEYAMMLHCSPTIVHQTNLHSRRYIPFQESTVLCVALCAILEVHDLLVSLLLP